MSMLPKAFLSRPIAHRGLHDVSRGVPENSRAAVQSAIDGGYGIEIDLQLTADGEAVVFHDYHLQRLTEGVGRVRSRTRKDLSTLRLKRSQETVPDFREILELVDGQVPLLVEIKDQDGALGDDVGELEAAVARDLEGYAGPVAVMSFNPHCISAMQALAPNIPRGLVTDAFAAEEYDASAESRASLARIEDFDRVGASFISHDWHYLEAPAVTDLKARGIPVLCWTIRTPEQEAEARRIADNVTFEGYLPASDA